MHHFLLNKLNNQGFIMSHFSTVKKKNLVGQSQIFIFLNYFHHKKIMSYEVVFQMILY